MGITIDLSPPVTVNVIFPDLDTILSVEPPRIEMFDLDGLLAAYGWPMQLGGRYLQDLKRIMDLECPTMSARAWDECRGIYLITFAGDIRKDWVDGHDDKVIDLMRAIATLYSTMAGLCLDRAYAGRIGRPRKDAADIRLNEQAETTYAHTGFGDQPCLHRAVAT